MPGQAHRLLATPWVRAAQGRQEALTGLPWSPQLPTSQTQSTGF